MSGCIKGDYAAVTKFIKPLYEEARLGTGLYTLGEAARYIRVSPNRLRAWFVPNDGKRKPVFHSDYASQIISFHDLIDAQVAAQLRGLGLSMQRIRLVYGALQEKHNLRHPFCSKMLFTDGKDVFVHGAEAAADATFVEVLTSQRYFPNVLAPFLKSIDYNATSGLAERWRIFDHVVIDPEVYFGKPVVVGSRVATQHIADEVRVNKGDTDLIADLYNLTEDEVRSAVAFEQAHSKRKVA